MTAYDLPFVNSVLNGCATVLLLAGFAAIRAKRVRLHRAVMLTALAVSAVFLASYLYYHIAVRGGQSTVYAGDWRAVYLVVLLSHVVLAAAAAPLALVTAGLALAGKFHRHLKVARWTFPIWLYVSVTGVLVYQFLRGQYPTGP